MKTSHTFLHTTVDWMKIEKRQYHSGAIMLTVYIKDKKSPYHAEAFFPNVKAFTTFLHRLDFFEALHTKGPRIALRIVLNYLKKKESKWDVVFQGLDQNCMRIDEMGERYA